MLLEAGANEKRYERSERRNPSVRGHCVVEINCCCGLSLRSFPITTVRNTSIAILYVESRTEVPFTIRGSVATENSKWKHLNICHVSSTDHISIFVFTIVTCLLAGIHRSFGGTAIAAMSTGRVTQVIGAVVDVQVIIIWRSSKGHIYRGMDKIL